MKKNKVFWKPAMILIFIFIVTACSQAASEPAAVSEPDESISVKTGTLIEASLQEISIQAPDGSTYKFGVDDYTAIHGSELLGNTMEVSYVGEYSSSIIAKVIKTIKEAEHNNDDSHSGKGSVEEPTAPKPKHHDETAADTAPVKKVDPADKIYYLTGTVVDASMHNIQLLYEDGKTYTVLKDDNTKEDPGIVVGCVARVFHKGGLKDGMVATEIHLIANPSPQPQARVEPTPLPADPPPPPPPPSPPADSPPPAHQTLTGVVFDSARSNITITGDDGVNYLFLKDDNTVIDGSGTVDLGNRVIITFDGDPSSTPVAIIISLAP